MSRKLQSLWRSWFRREQAERELDEELRFHLDAQIEANVRAGMTPEEARRQAQIELGRVEQVKEEVRAIRPGVFFDTLWQDVRFGARMLRKNPGFTAVAALTLALGIGACTAIFSAVNPILFEPLPYPQAGRIMMLWDTFNGARTDVTFHTFREVAERSRSFDSLAVMKPWQPTLTGPAEPERLEGQRVSADYFRALRVPPAMGRGFEASDDQLNGPKVAILSHGLWQRRFGGDPKIVGRAVTLDDNLYTVVGVMPAAFENVLAPSAELWSPLQYDERNITSLQTREWGHHLRLVARLRTGARTDQARRELELIARTPVSEFPRPRWASLRDGLIVDSLQDNVTRGVKPALLAVLGAAILVLLIACVNVTNLLLVRGAQRRGEFAVRAALGAGRAQMLRQLLTESLLLAALGGALGMVVATFGLDTLVALSPPELPRVNAIRVDISVFAFALGITTLIGLLVGLIPALHASRADLHLALQQTSRRVVGGHQFTRRALVVAEVALTFVLLVSAGLLLRSLQRLFAVEPGFTASNLLTMQVHTAGRRFDNDTTHRFFERALEAARQVPGVTSAAFTSQLPLSGDNDVYGANFEHDNPDAGFGVFRYAVTPDYFETLGIPLRRGRLLDARDVAGAPLAVLVSESLAKRKFPGQDPIGRRVHVGPTDRPWYTIVGVVGDVKQMSLALSESDAVYVTPTQWHFADNAMWLVVRARADALSLAPSIRRAIWSVDKDQPIVRVATMDALLAESAADRRFALVVFEAFGLAALVLAATGIYGVMSYSVVQQRHEIGIRLALGAQRGDVFRMVAGRGLTLTLIGIAIGLAGAFALTRFLTTLLFGVEALDPSTFAGVVLLLGVVALAASWVPARRATRVDPMVALRYE